MEPKRTINAKDIVTSIVSGLTDQELMEKYKLTPRGLQSVFRKLLTLKLLDRSKFYDRLSASYFPEDSEIVRKSDRTEMLLPLEIHDLNDPDCRGILTNLAAEGVGIQGISAQVGDARRFKVLADEYFQLAPFVFDAQCRWTKIEAGEVGQSAGFEITSISESEKAKLLHLVETLAYLYQSEE